jgi:site-specific DNA-methyltransferase (adenine-specific)
LIEGGSWDTSKMGENVYSGGWAGKRVPSQKKKISDYEKYVEKQKSFKGAKTIGKVKEGGTTFLGGDMKQQNPAEVYQKPQKKTRVSAFGDPDQSETGDGRNLWGKKSTKIVEVDLPPTRKTTKRKPREEGTVFKTSGFKSEDNDTAEASPLGRFPANLLVSDDVLNDGKIRKAGKYKGEGSKSGGIWSKSTGEPAGREYGDKGDFSRYYSLDEWWKRYFKDLPEEVQKTFPFIIVPKANKREKNMGLKKNKFSKAIGHNRFDQCATCGGYILQNQDRPSACKCETPVRKDNTIKGNFHPTVKPVQLFSYLITLGSRKGDVVLDPFAGSGTTGISCVFSERNYILIEREKEYFKIIEARIEKAKNPANLVEHGWF